MSWFTRYVATPVIATATVLLPYACGHWQSAEELRQAEEKRIRDSLNIESYVRTLTLDRWDEIVQEDGSILYVYPGHIKSQGDTTRGLSDSIRKADTLANAPSDDGWYPGYRPPGYDHVDPPPVNVPPNVRPPF